MMQSWDNISKHFSGHAYEFLRFKGTPVSWVKVVWEPWCLPRHSFHPLACFAWEAENKRQVALC